MTQVDDVEHGEQQEQRPTPRFLAQPPPMPKVPGKVGIAFIVALVVLAGINGGWGLLAVIASLTVIVSLHELGHFLTAKWAGMKVTEFFLGIGPKLWSTTRGETEYGIKLIPAVAYVRIIGMHNLEEVAEADEPRSYRQQAFHKRLIVVCAGSAMHFAMALLAIWGLLVFHGAQGGHVYPSDHLLGFEIVDVDPSSAAAAAGVQPHDQIVNFNGTPVNPSVVDDEDVLAHAIQTVPGQTVPFTVLRDGQTIELHATVGTVNGVGRLGIHMAGIEPPFEKVSPIAAVPTTFGDFGNISVQVVQGLGQVFSPHGIGHLFTLVTEGNNNDQGPVVANPSSSNNGSSTSSSSSSSNDSQDRPVSIIGIAQIGSQLSGPELVFFMFVLVNIFFGLFNLLPLLPFDGGHAAIAIYEKIQSVRYKRTYRADILKLLPITYGVVAVLLFVGVSAMYLDIVLGNKI